MNPIVMEETSANIFQSKTKNHEISLLAIAVHVRQIVNLGSLPLMDGTMYWNFKYMLLLTIKKEFSLVHVWGFLVVNQDKRDTKLAIDLKSTWKAI